MFESQLDDSSAASSGDEMLNLVPFSQETTTSSTTPEKRAGVDSADNLQPGAKRKHDEIDSEIISDEVKMEEKARENAQKAFDIAFHGCKIRNLYWRNTSRKGTSKIYPVRLPTREEIVGLRLREYNGDTECPVQDIQYPHPQVKGRGVGQFDIASKKSLTPHHGEDQNRWCATKVGQYLKQLKRAHKNLQPIDLKTEECFLQIVLERSLLEKEQDAKRAEVDEAVPEEIHTPISTEEQRIESDSDDEDADDNTTRRPRLRTRGSSNGVHERSERLRVGDQIAFYTQMGVAGDASAYREATVHGIDPKAEHILTIDDAFTNLQPEHQVKRIRRMYRGKLVNHDGQWRSINDYILKKEGDPDAYRKVLAGEHARVSEIRQRNKDEMIAKMEKDGFCPKDLLR